MHSYRRSQHSTHHLKLKRFVFSAQLGADREQPLVQLLSLLALLCCVHAKKIDFGAKIRNSKNSTIRGILGQDHKIKSNHNGHIEGGG
jgi:hypothetical protein